MRDYYVITDGKGNYLTRKGLGADMSLSDNHNFAYTYDTEKDAESVIKAAQKMPAFKNVELKVISKKEIKESRVMKHIPTFENFQKNDSNKIVNEAEDKKDWEKEVSELSDRMVSKLVYILNNGIDGPNGSYDALLSAAVWEKKKRRL